MSYKFSTGSVRKGDIYFEDDRQGSPTYIDFGMDTITLRPSGSAILFAESDKVGIGTTTPGSELHVYGTSTETKIKVQTNNDTAGIWLDNEKTGGRQYSIKSIGGGASAGQGKLLIKDETAGATRITIDQNGKVGIGTTAPSKTLTVAGDISATGDIFLENTQGLRIKATGGYSGMVMDLDSNNHLNIGTWTGTDVRFSTNASDPKEAADIDLLIDGAAAREGNVGIGTGTEAYSKLSIGGSVQFNVTSFTAGATLDGTHHVVIADNNASSFTITLPSVSANITGRQYIIKRADSEDDGTPYSLTIGRNGADIDGAESDISSIGNGTSHTLICIGADGWILVDKYVGI